MTEPELLIIGERSPAHRALAKAAPAKLTEIVRAVESVAIAEAVDPRAAMAFERITVHQVARALGVKP